MNRFFILIVTSVIFTFHAQAYIPPSFFIVKRISEKRSGPKFISVVSKVSAAQEGQPTSLSFSQNTVVDLIAGTLVSWASDSDTGAKLFGVERHLGVAGTGSVLPAPSMDYLIFSPQLVALARSLIQAGVPVRTEIELNTMANEEERRSSEVLSLKRWNGMICWVIGNEASGGAQLWVEKDSFVPLRLMIPDKLNPREIRILNHRMAGGFLYPHQLTYLAKEQALLIEDVVSVNGNASSKEFNALSNPATLVKGWTETGRQASADLRELITQYYSNVR